MKYLKVVLSSVWLRSFPQVSGERIVNNLSSILIVFFLLIGLVRTVYFLTCLIFVNFKCRFIQDLFF